MIDSTIGDLAKPNQTALDDALTLDAYKALLGVRTRGNLGQPATINRDAEPPQPTVVWSWIADPSQLPESWTASVDASVEFTWPKRADCPITYWDALDGQSEEEVDEFAEEIRSDERERIASLLSAFRDDNVSQRRDTELRRVARNSLLDELAKWLAEGGMAYTPKD